jgi:hypothetical protein
MDPNELAGTQPQPEGTTAEIPGNETAPEQTNDELHTDGGEGEGSESGSEASAEAGGERGEGQQESEKPKPKQTFYEKRFGELTRQKRDAERRAEDAEARLAALERGETVTTPAEGETQPKSRQQSTQTQPETDVERAAERLVEHREYTKRVNGVIAAGEAEFDKDDFTKKCNLIADIGGSAVPEFMKIVTDSDVVTDGHKVIAALADDPDEAERILSLNPVKMALALTKLSEKLAKPVPKQHSKVPAPVEPVNGAARTSTRLDDPNIPMDDFAKEFLKGAAARRR